MQKIEKKELTNRGASLVLVIVCMLFVGIIAAAILTLTSGNINSNKTNESSNDNFYSAESIIDELKAYLQRVANGSATKAYAQVISDKAASALNGKSDEEAFTDYYNQYLKDDIEAELASGNLRSMISGTPEELSNGLGIAESIASGVSFLNSEDICFDETTNTLKGIRINFTDASNYSTKIDTDLTFACSMPDFNYERGGSSFPYDIDKFLLIGEGGIATDNDVYVKGTMVGNLYSGNDIEFIMASSDPITAKLDLYSQYVISKGALDVSNGIMNFKRLASAGSAVQYLALKRTPSDLTKVVNGDLKSGQDDATMYVGGITLSKGKPEIHIPSDSKATLYVSDDLSLNGNDSKFIIDEVKDKDENVIKTVKYFGFNSDNTKNSPENAVKSVDNHKGSSAITVNGVNSVLDMECASELTLAGTAYTQVPAIVGKKEEENFSYFVQGESVTFKSLQSSYLVPGNYITIDGKVVGQNPIPASYKTNLKPEEIVVDKSGVGKDTSGTDISLTKNVRRVVTVRYANDSSSPDYYYVFWDFASAQDAVNYFNAKYSYNEEFYKSKIGMIGKDGKIILPDVIHSKGDVIEWTDSELSTPDKSWGKGNSDSCGEYSDDYTNFCKGLSKNGASDESLWNNLFERGDASWADISFSDTLKGPSDWNVKTADNVVLYQYSGNVVKADGSKDLQAYTYELHTGIDITINATDSNKKYVVISGGDVSITGNFSGIVIAKGTITVSGNVDMHCFGNFINTIEDKVNDTTTTEYISEFEALLNVIDDDSDDTKANTVLRKIFGVAGNATNAGGEAGKAGNLASVDTINYKKN